MKFSLLILIIILSSCGSSKSGIFSCRCENIDKTIGVKEVSFEYAKGAYEGESSDIYAHFSVDQNEKDCFKFIFYFDKMHDTLQMVGTIEGYQKFTTPNLQTYLERGEKLKLKITNTCNSIEHVYNVKCIDLEESNVIRGH
jgi:hypothetical protein